MSHSRNMVATHGTLVQREKYPLPLLCHDPRILFELFFIERGQQQDNMIEHIVLDLAASLCFALSVAMCTEWV